MFAKARLPYGEIDIIAKEDKIKWQTENSDGEVEQFTLKT
jgi:Holliday junction resolvase-like predicted endonuclease